MVVADPGKELQHIQLMDIAIAWTTWSSACSFRWVAGDALLLESGDAAIRCSAGEAFEHGLLHIAKLIFPESTHEEKLTASTPDGRVCVAALAEVMQIPQEQAALAPQDARGKRSRARSLESTLPDPLASTFASSSPRLSSC